MKGKRIAEVGDLVLVEWKGSGNPDILIKLENSSWDMGQAAAWHCSGDYWNEVEILEKNFQETAPEPWKWKQTDFSGGGIVKRGYFGKEVPVEITPGEWSPDGVHFYDGSPGIFLDGLINKKETASEPKIILNMPTDAEIREHDLKIRKEQSEIFPGPVRLTTQPDNSMNWKEWCLWGFIIICAIVAFYRWGYVK